MTRMTVNSCW